jgi:hypothetical protein
MKTKEIWSCVSQAEIALAPILAYIESGEIDSKAQSAAAKIKKDIADLYATTLSYSQERNIP